MSWRYVAAKTITPTSNHKPKLIVKSNVNFNSTTNTTKDSIPRHREIISDPSDDFLMTNGKVPPQTTTRQVKNKKIDAANWANYSGGFIDYKRDSKLRRFKKTLPLSVQRIVEFANILYIDNRVVDLNFEEIERDLKYQHKKYNGNQTKLKKIYFNYNPDSKCNQDFHMFNYRKTKHYDKRYSMLFDSPTSVHYLFKHLLFQSYQMRASYWPCLFEITKIPTIHSFISNNAKIKLMKQILKMIQLLVSNRILNIQDILYTGDPGLTVWECIKRLSCSLNKETYSHKIMHDVVDLITICLNNTEFEQQEAIVRIMHRVYEYDENDPNPTGANNEFYYLNLMKSDKLPNYWYTKMCNTNQVIDQLLFRGMIPFQFVEEHIKVLYNAENETRKSVTTINYKQPVTQSDTKEYIANMMKKEKILVDKFSDRYEQQMIILSSLVLMPHLDRAKQKMYNILTAKCNTYIKSEPLTNDICNIIIHYLFVNYRYLYNMKQIENNTNANVMCILSNFMHLEHNKRFTRVFKGKYYEKEFMKQLVENYLELFMRSFTDETNYYYKRENKKVKFKLLMNFIRTCNKYQDIKFPLQNGIYKVLSFMIDNYDFREKVCVSHDHWNQKVIRFLQYIQRCYKEEFDINFAVNSYRNDSILSALIRRGGYKKCGQIFRFILEEFKNEYDTDSPCLLYTSLKYKRIKIFVYLAMKDPRYTVSYICDTLVKMVKENANISGPWWHSQRSVDKYCVDSNWLFLDLVKQFCLRFVCRNDNDEQLIEKSIRFAWKWYGKKCQLHWKTYSVNNDKNVRKFIRLRMFVKNEFASNTGREIIETSENETNIQSDFTKNDICIPSNVYPLIMISIIFFLLMSLFFFVIS